MDTDLPQYSPRTQTSHTVEHIRTCRTNAAFIFKFRSHAARPDSTPIFFSGQTITGTVELAVHTKTTIKAVTVQFRGYQQNVYDVGDIAHSTSGTGGDKAFLELLCTLWPTSTGETRIDPGIHSWKFSLQIPATTSSFPKDGREFALPPSFSHRKFPDHLMYEMVARVDRGGFTGESRIVMPVRYVWRNRPDPPHPAFLVAYAERQDLPNPDICPLGWSTTDTVLSGRLFSQRDVTLQVRFSLVSPLMYGRGSYLHCYLSIECDDSQALDVVASTSSCCISLWRRYVGWAIGKTGNQLANTDLDMIAKGKLWSPSTNDLPPNTRAFYGEIFIPKDLDPDFATPKATLSHYVELKVEATGFAPTSISNGICTSVPVVISGERAQGLTSHSLAPAPAYVAPRGIRTSSHPLSPPLSAPPPATRRATPPSPPRSRTELQPPTRSRPRSRSQSQSDPQRPPQPQRRPSSRGRFFTAVQNLMSRRQVAMVNSEAT